MEGRYFEILWWCDWWDEICCWNPFRQRISSSFFFPSVEPPERTNVSLVINPFLCGDFLVCPKIKCHKCFFLQNQPAFFLEVIRTLRVGILLENSPPGNGKWTVKLLKFGIWPKNVMGDHRHPGCIGASLIFSCLTVVESVYWYISTLTYQFQSAASNETHGKLSLWMFVWLIGQTNRFPAKHPSTSSGRFGHVLRRLATHPWSIQGLATLKKVTSWPDV